MGGTRWYSVALISHRHSEALVGNHRHSVALGGARWRSVALGDMKTFGYNRTIGIVSLLTLSWRAVASATVCAATPARPAERVEFKSVNRHAGC